MKAALTGGTGFVGSHLAEALRAQGAEVRCLVRDRRRGTVPADLGCVLVEGTLLDGEALAELTSGADVVFHVAGAIAARSEDEFFRINRGGTEAVAQAARAAGAQRLVFVSSLSVTGPSARGRPAPDGAPPRPISAYGRSKAAAEAAVRAAGVPFTVVRPPAVYGPRDTQFLRLFRAARRGVLPVLLRDQELSFIHASDLAEALIAAALAPAAAGRTYHATHPEVVTQSQFLQAVSEAVGRAARLVPVPAVAVRAALHLAGLVARVTGRRTLLTPQKAAELLAESWTCQGDALTSDTGWRARTALAAGLLETARWYEAHGWL